MTDCFQNELHVKLADIDNKHVVIETYCSTWQLSTEVHLTEKQLVAHIASLESLLEQLQGK